VIQPERPADLPREKASLVFAAPNAPGALYDCLGHFARRGLNLTKIESRPTRDTPWEYYFYLDFEGDLSVPYVEGLLDELRGAMAFVRLLGVYPARTP